MTKKYQSLKTNILLQLIIVANQIKSKNLVDKSAISGFINNADLHNKVATLAPKSELKAKQDKIAKLQTFDSSYFQCKSHFAADGAQNYLIFQPMYRYFKKIIGVGTGEYIYFWKSKGLSDERINSITTADYSITPE